MPREQGRGTLQLSPLQGVCGGGPSPGDPMGQGEGSGHGLPKTPALSCVDRGARASGATGEEPEFNAL